MKRDTMTYEGDWKEGQINGEGKILWTIWKWLYDLV